MKKPSQSAKCVLDMLPPPSANLIVSPVRVGLLVGEQIEPAQFGGPIMPEGFVTETGLLPSPSTSSTSLV